MFLKIHPSDPSELIIILLPGMSPIDHPEIIDPLPVYSIAAQLFANKPNRVCIQHGYVYLIGAVFWLVVKTSVGMPVDATSVNRQTYRHRLWTPTFTTCDFLHSTNQFKIRTIPTFFMKESFQYETLRLFFVCLFFSLFVVFKMFKVKLLIWYRRSLYVTGKIFRTGE